MVEVVGNWIVWACGIIISLWGVLGIIQKIIEITKKPEKDQNEKIAKIEQEIADLKKQDETFMGFFKNDKERIDSISKGSAVMQQALLALLSHSIDGNNDAEMKQARAELQKYLTGRITI